MTTQTDANSPANAIVAPTRPGKIAYLVTAAVLLALGALLFAT